MDLKREHFCHRWKSLEKWAERAKVLLCHNVRRLIGACLIRLQMKDETDWDNNKKVQPHYVAGLNVAGLNVAGLNVAFTILD
jgi:hypothetical protein